MPTARMWIWSCGCAGREGRCRLARAPAERTSTRRRLGPGSARKDFLTGYGRGYLLRKWGVLTPRRLPGVLARELVALRGTGAVDRNLAGVRGRLRGLREARKSEPYPLPATLPDAPGLRSTLWRRWRRRVRLRRSAE